MEKTTSKQVPWKSSTLLITFGISILLLALVCAGNIVSQQTSTRANAQSYQVIVTEPPVNAQPNLQLRTFRVITVIPTPPKRYSSPDSPRSAGGECTETDMLMCNECKAVDADPSNITKLLGMGCAYIPSDPQFNANLGNPNCIRECIGKPVIYLYPTKDTLVDVKVETQGSIYVSDPLYPVEGWKNVLAHPDGTMEYQRKKYHELYYESAVDAIIPPRTGLIIPASQLQTRLREYTAQLGLIEREQEEFLDYWLPKLTAIHSPYILFSILDTHEKERVDHVRIAPNPDTLIAFIAYFKPLAYPIAIDPLILPSTPQQRIGFTAVEWGGTIDYKK